MKKNYVIITGSLFSSKYKKYKYKMGEIYLVYHKTSFDGNFASYTVVGSNNFRIVTNDCRLLNINEIREFKLKRILKSNDY